MQSNTGRINELEDAVGLGLSHQNPTMMEQVLCTHILGIALDNAPPHPPTR